MSISYVDTCTGFSKDCFLLFQPHGFMENVISYSSIVDINNISRWDAGHKFCFRITIADGSLLLQVSVMVIICSGR